MNFCPFCGETTQYGQNFCRRCGYDISLRKFTPESLLNTLLESPVYAMRSDSLYVFDEDGLIRIGTRFQIVVVPIFLAVVLALSFVVVLNLESWAGMSVAFSLFLLPVFGECRARHVSRLLRLPKEDLLRRKDVRSMPWSSLQYLTINGRRINLKFANKWTSATLDKEGPDLLRLKASEELGGNFVYIPNRPPRISPAWRFMLLGVLLFGLTQLISTAASLTPFYPGEQERYTTLYNSVKAGLGTTIVQQWAEIFFNNVQIAMTSLIPGLGVFTLILSSYNTGRVIQVAAVNFGVAPSIFLFVLYLLPHSLIEEISYPLSAALGLHALSWRRQSYSEFSNWRTRAATKVSLGFLVIAVVIAIAAALEVAEPLLDTTALLLWGPVLLGGIYAYFRLRPKIIAALS